MPTRTIETEADLKQAFRWLEGMKRPFTLQAEKGRRRSTKQNRLQRQWMNDIAHQMGEGTAPEDIRAYCKLTIGVPILRAENELFCERYDAVVKPLPYEQKIILMAEPLDFPVTRLMNSEQKTRYLDGVSQHFTEKGFVLTDPEALGAAA